MIGSKSKYTQKQKRQAKEIAKGYKQKRVPAREAKKRAWATVNKLSGGGRKSGAGKGRTQKELSTRKKSVARSTAATKKGSPLKRRATSASKSRTTKRSTASSARKSPKTRRSTSAASKRAPAKKRASAKKAGSTRTTSRRSSSRRTSRA